MIKKLNLLQLKQNKIKLEMPDKEWAIERNNDLRNYLKSVVPSVLSGIISRIFLSVGEALSGNWDKL